MANGTIAPFPKHQLFTNAGLIASGYQLFTYAAGTTTKLATYNDADLQVAHQNANPIVLDSAGRATIFLTASAYKFVLASPTDTDPPGSPIWTVDNVSATSPFFQDIDVQGTAGEALTAGDGVYMSAGDGALTAGRWYKWDADLTYASSTANAIGMVPSSIASGEVGSIRIAGRMTGLAGLTTGAPYYISATAGGITSSGPPNTRTVGVADSTTSLLLSHTIINQTDVMGQAGEDLASGDAVYLSVGDGAKTAGRWYRMDADDALSSTGPLIIGVAKVAILTSATGPITSVGRMGGYTGLTPGAVQYASTNVGALTETAPVNARAVGIADSNRSIRLIPGPPPINYQRRVKTSQSQVTSTTLIDVDGLFFNIAANERWSFRFHLFGLSTAAADIKFKVTVPSAPDNLRYGLLAAGPPITAGVGIEATSYIDASVAAANDEHWIISGYIDNGVNDGTVQLQFGQVVDDGSTTLVHAHSFCLAERIYGQP